MKNCDTTLRSKSKFWYHNNRSTETVKTQVAQITQVIETTGTVATGNRERKQSELETRQREVKRGNKTGDHKDRCHCKWKWSVAES